MTNNSKLLIKNGRVIDPANKRDSILDILIENNKISKVAENIQPKKEKVIDAKDKIVLPGLVDMHVHLREPGREDKETVYSGTHSAVKGGITSLLCLPNTLPVIDCVENVKLLKSIIKMTACANVFIAASITNGRLGRELTDIAALKKQGILVISDDGSSVDDEELMFLAFKKAKENGILIVCHCEDVSLSKKGVVNFGFTSTRMGLRGISNESEYKRIERDIKLAQKAKASLHIAHVSCRESVEAIAKAKKKGLNITCETAPHYFSLDEEAVLGYDTNTKMNPPLRSKKDKEAIIKALKDGIIDVIASDHAPHTDIEKDIEFERAAFGVIGLETELAVAITELVDKNILSFSSLVEKMAFNPSRIIGIDRGNLAEGKEADIIVVSPGKQEEVVKENIVSKSKNSPFLGRRLKGLVEYTIVSGEIAYQYKI